ncbi:siderophore-interacting protein [Rhizobium deserti]|uniref:Siderophore-interacting protein n=1 Tax=Rhizobium deserti TaxID=2547961 RepID=A0A4R5UMG2_9HYPH|nr:siderophore-interacting protein [Rhizobium deserti]TDK38959.1 siderophore-interacting protein [Rhizobium deserti]
MTDISSQDQTSQMSMPCIERVRHELKRRELTVRSVEKLTPNMLRIALVGEDLADFLSASPDDHVKIFLPTAEGEPERRDYTPRRYDTAARELVLDFAVHEAGPATQWALEAQVGSRLSIGGPRGSAVISGVKHWILVGDETALPSMGRRVEEAGPDETFTVIGAVTGSQEEQTFETAAQLRTIWVHRPLSAAANASDIISVLNTVDIPAETFAWIAAEASVARAVRAYLTEGRNHPLPWLKAAGYWVQGLADAHEKLD